MLSSSLLLLFCKIVKILKLWFEINFMFALKIIISKQPAYYVKNLITNQPSLHINSSNNYHVNFIHGIPIEICWAKMCLLQLTMRSSLLNILNISHLFPSSNEIRNQVSAVGRCEFCSIFFNKSSFLSQSFHIIKLKQLGIRTLLCFFIWHIWHYLLRLLSKEDKETVSNYISERKIYSFFIKWLFL